MCYKFFKNISKTSSIKDIRVDNINNNLINGSELEMLEHLKKMLYLFIIPVELVEWIKKNLKELFLNALKFMD